MTEGTVADSFPPITVQLSPSQAFWQQDAPRRASTPGGFISQTLQGSCPTGTVVMFLKVVSRELPPEWVWHCSRASRRGAREREGRWGRKRKGSESTVNIYWLLCVHQAFPT